MTCERCGSPSNGRLCASCEQMDRVERNHEHQKRSDGGVQSDDTAEVIQGRLGWESGDISEADPSNLKPHPKNAEIYGDTDDIDDLDATFKESVAEKGVLEPLVITNGKEIISGHRRWLAARDAGLDEVPVRYSEFDDELAEREALIEFNRQREKTPGQIVNEAEEVLQIERERGKRRMSEGGSGGVKGSSDLTNHDQDESHDSWEKAAEKVDVGATSLKKGKTVKEKAESDDEPEEVREAAREAWDGLQSGDESFNSAYQDVKKAENKVEKKREREKQETSFSDALESNDAVAFYNCTAAELTDQIEPESVDHVITDPPYDEDAVDDWRELATVSKELLKPGGLLAAYSGKYHLPEVHDALASELEYYWQFIVRHKGPGARIWPRNVRTDYKPVLVYRKKPIEPLDDLAHDVIDGAGREKDDHEWQQAEAEAVELIEQLTEPDDRILDPMCGSGTTGAAAIGANRRVILADRDADAVNTAKGRVHDVL